MSSRWRGLTHEYLRGVLAASTPNACQLPTPPSSPSISALYKSKSNEPLSIRTLRERDLFELNVRGILAILSAVGLEVDHAPLPPPMRPSSVPRSDLSTVVSGVANGDMINATKVVDMFGEALKRIQEQTIELARVTKEGVMSGWFDVTRVPGAVTLPTPTSTPSLPPSQQVWAHQTITPQKGGRRATVDVPPRRPDSAAGDRRMSESSLALRPSSPQTPSRSRPHDRTTTQSPHRDRTPTHTPSHTPNIDRSPILDRPHTPSSPSPHVSKIQTSPRLSPARPQVGKPVVTKFDHNIMENVFHGIGQEDGECVVMCTIEFGLNCAKKVVSDEDLGILLSPTDSPVEFSTSGFPEKGVNGAETVEKRTLVKPKVLLENAIEIGSGHW